MLRNKADEVLIDTDLPTTVLKRSRRRRAVTVALGSALGVMVIVGGFFGAQAMLAGNEEGLKPATTGPPGVTEPWRGLWPQDTREEAEAAQESLDSGSDEFAFQAYIPTLLKSFGGEIHLWTETFIVSETLDTTPPGPHTLHISNCSLQGPESEGGGCENAYVTVEQLLETGEGELWFVTVDDAYPPEENPSPDPGEEGATVEATNAFMDARIAGSGAEKWLTQDSQGWYEAHDQSGLYLYDGDVQGGEPYVNYEDYEIVSVVAHEDPDPRSAVGHDVRVRILHGMFEGNTVTHDEILWVATGLGLDNKHHLVVRTATRLETDPGEPRKSCQEGSSTPVQSCARSFMQTRLDGAGAEFYMTPDARAVYDEPDNELHLYGTPYEDSGNFRFDRYQILGVRQADANSYEVDVRLFVIAEGGPMTIFETLVIGPGRNSNEELQDFVIRGAEGHYE
jgi:hypothetical protein